MGVSGPSASGHTDRQAERPIVVESRRSRCLALPRLEAQQSQMKTYELATAITAIGAMTLLAASPSRACSFAQQKLTAAQVRQKARNDFRRASAVIDAEVVAPMRFGEDWKPGLTPIAYLQASKVWKGRVERDSVPIVYITSCDIGLVTKGEKLRILLTGNGVFRADQGMNGGGVAELRTYNAEIDRLAGQRRPSAMAHFPGTLPPPSRRRNVR